jgi:PEP-CTERM motif-containing protein
MKILTYSSVVVLFTLLSFPITAQAMGSRHHSWELAQNQSAPHNSEGLNPHENGGTYNVPEPSSLWLLGIGIVLLAMLSKKKWFRREDACREKTM